MKHLKLYENFLNEGNYNISDKEYKEGQFGPEFDKWIKDCSDKAKEKNWNDWIFRFGENIDTNKIVYFMVNEKSFDSKNIKKKGFFDLRNKKFEIQEF